MYRLVNSAMMPAPGRYELHSVTRDKFVMLLQHADQERMLLSYIGYPQTAQFLTRISRVDVGVCRDRTPIVDGDTLLIVRLNYRPEAGTKGREVVEDDFEFFVATFRDL